MTVQTRSLNSIQLLRGVAALLVVLFHLHIVEGKYGRGTATLPDLLLYANAGVDLFFVVSGFVMTCIAAGHYRSMQEAGRFLARRAWRVYPPYWVYTTVVLILMTVAPGLANSSYPDQDVLASYLLWPDKQLPLLAVGWTLIHEVYFYLMMALAIAFLPERSVPFYLLAWAVASQLGFASLSPQAAPWAQLVTHPLTLEFIAGAFIGLYWRRLPARMSVPLCMAGGIALALVLVFLAAPEQPQPLMRVVLFGLPCAMMVLGAVRWELQGLQVPRWILAVGDSSYSLYLSHVFVLSALGWLWRGTGWNLAVWQHVGFAALAVLCCVAVGLVSYYCLERPLLMLGRKFRSPRAIRST